LEQRVCSQHPVSATASTCAISRYYYPLPLAALNSQKPPNNALQADFLGGLALEAVAASAAEGRSFFVLVNPTMPHWTACFAGCADGTDSCYAEDDPHWEFSLPLPGETGRARLNSPEACS